MLRKVYERYEGLQECEGRTQIIFWGEGKGSCLREVCEDIIRKDPEKGKYFEAKDDDHCSDWGMELLFL